jgi:hypothetical protein
VTHISDDIYLGGVGVGAQPSLGGPIDQNTPSPSGYGFGPVGRVYIWDVVPIALSATGICAAQAMVAPGNAVINGTRAQVQPDGTTAAVLDYDRRLTMVSTGADTTQTITITGLDRYGQPLSWAGLLNGTTPVVIPKTFKQVTRVASSALLAGNLSVGYNDALGLPALVPDAGYILSTKWNGAVDAGTFVAGVATSPATPATGDVRGVYTPTTVADGTKRLVMAIALTGLQVGPNATRVGLAGVNQNLVV